MRKGSSKANPSKKKALVASKFQDNEDEATSGGQGLNLDQLPEDILLIIFSFLSYNEVALLRVVSKRFNLFCQVQLNRGFHAVKNLSGRTWSSLETKLPKRPSKRSQHPLALHLDLVENVKNAVEDLSFSLEDYVKKARICYFPGMFIDEAFGLLRMVNHGPPLPEAPFILTTTLEDLGSMALRHFEIELEPCLKKKSKKLRKLNETYDMYSSESSIAPSPVRKSLTPSRSRDSILQDEVRSLKEENKKLKERLDDLERRFNALTALQQPAVASLEKTLAVKTDPAVKVPKKKQLPNPTPGPSEPQPLSVPLKKKALGEKPAAAVEKATKKRPEPKSIPGLAKAPSVVPSAMRMAEKPGPKKLPDPRPAASALTRSNRPSTTGQADPDVAMRSRAGPSKRTAPPQPDPSKADKEPLTKKPKKVM